MSNTAPAKRRATIVSSAAYADRCRRVDELLKACAERDKVIAAQRTQIRELRRQVLAANKRTRRAEARNPTPREQQAAAARSHYGDVFDEAEPALQERLMREVVR